MITHRNLRFGLRALTAPWLGSAALLGALGCTHAASPAKHDPPPGEILATSASNPKEVGNRVRDALGTSIAPNKQLTVVVKSKSAAPQPPAVAERAGAHVVVNPQVRRQLLQSHANARSRSANKPESEPSEPLVNVHWSYSGAGEPLIWGQLKPEYALCGSGKRQAPIGIEDGTTLLGPAEPIQFQYTGSNATVIHNGHTIQVDVQGDNSIAVRGSSYRLVQFHFHTPSEEQINQRRFAMVAHLVHRNDEGQLAVVAVLMEPGATNPLIDKVWTFMPLDVHDQVRMPHGLLNLNELLPADQRYYQFIGSLTTPPCTEGVLWLVLKQPVEISKAQHRLFTQLFPHNARPIQPLHGRPVREAQ